MSISPTMSRFMGAVFGQQLRSILEHHYGPERHGFRKGHSTVSLLHILEIIIDEAKANNTEVVIVQIDVAKAFDEIHRDAMESIATVIIAPARQKRRHLSGRCTKETKSKSATERLK